MALRDRFIFWNGENLKELVESQDYEARLIYSDFSEELPKPKIIKVSIPFGSDLDITERLGQMAYSDGTHTIKFLLWADSRVHLNIVRDRLIAKVHGVYASYYLDWTDNGRYEWMYNGRAEVSVEHKGETCDVITIKITRSPWKRSWTWETVEIDCHPTARYKLEGSKRYRDVQITTPVAGYKTKVGTASTVTHPNAVSNETLASDLYGDVTIIVTAPDWLMYVNGSDLVVNSSKISISGNDAVISSEYTVTDGDIEFAGADAQKASIRFIRYDI